MAGPSERSPQRSVAFDPAIVSRRGEVAAALATAALLGQLLFTQLTLVVAVILVLSGRATRWRPHWLVVPATAGLAWMLAEGTHRTLAGFVAGPRSLAMALVHRGRLAHFAAVFGGAGHWLPGQLPVALLAGTAEAGLLLWLGWRGADTTSQAWRPGLIAMLRRRANVAALSAGQTVTAEGWSAGVETGSGRLATISWTEAEHGVLATGARVAEPVQVSLPAVCAALRRRKGLVVLDLSGRAPVCDLVAGLSRSLAGVTASLLPAGTAAGRDSQAASIGQAVLRREVVLVPAGGSGLAAMADLAAVLSRLAELRLRGDALAWVNGFGAEHAAALGELIALGPQTGLSVLLSTANPAAAASLAEAVDIIIAAGPVHHELSRWLAGDLSGPAHGTGRVAPDAPLTAAARRVTWNRTSPFPAVSMSGSEAASALTAQPAGSLTLLARGRPIVRCEAVPVRLGEPR